MNREGPLAMKIAKIADELETIGWKRILPRAVVAGITAYGIANGWNEEVASDSEVSSFVTSVETDIADNSKLDALVSSDLGYGSFFIDANLYSRLDLRVIGRDERTAMSAKRRSAYFELHEDIVFRIKKNPAYNSLSNIDRWNVIFEAYQLEALVDYNIDSFDFGGVVETGSYNCNSGTAGFASTIFDLAKERYVDATPLRFIQFGDKEPGHILVGYANADGQIIQYFESTNPNNNQYEDYQKGRVLTLEEYVAGYLLGMGIDSVPTRKLLELQEEQDSAVVDWTISSIVLQRNKFKSYNRTHSNSKQVSDPFLFPTMGYDLPISDPDVETDYTRFAETSLVILDFDRARYFTELAYRRGQLKEEEYRGDLVAIVGIEQKTQEAIKHNTVFTPGDICLFPEHDAKYNYGSHQDAVNIAFRHSISLASCENSGKDCSSLRLGRISDISVWSPELISFGLEETKKLLAVKGEDLDTKMDVLWYQGDLYAQREQFEDAISSYQQSLAVMKEKKQDKIVTERMVKILSDIGTVYHKMHDDQNAFIFYQEAEQNATTSYDLVGVAQDMRKIKQYDVAMAVAQKAIAMDPNYIDAYGIAGDIIRSRYGAGRKEEERQYYEQALALAEKQNSRSLQRTFHGVLYEYFYHQRYMMTPEAQQHWDAYYALREHKGILVIDRK